MKRVRQPIPRTLGLVVICLIAGLAAPAVEGSTPPIRFERIGLEDGLSQTTVLSIAQDERGFMWFGTEDGLNRYDGREFKHFRHQVGVDQSLGGDFVWTVAEGAGGDLWVGTDGGGLSRRDRATGAWTTFRRDPEDQSSIASDRIRSLAVDAGGRVWIGTFSSGVSVLDPAEGGFIHFRHDPDQIASLSSDHTYALCVDGRGNIWVGTDGGLDRIDPSTGEVARFDITPADSRVRALAEDSDGFVWIGTFGEGLTRLDPTTGETLTYHHDPNDSSSLSHDRVRVVHEDGAGRLWVGTVAGLNLFDRARGTFTRFTHDSANSWSLSGDDVISISEDRGGVLWVGTQAHGLNRWNPNSWSFGLAVHDPGNPNSLSHDNVTSFCDDGSRLWVGTFGGGLSVFERSSGTVRHLRADAPRGAGPSVDRVMALLCDQQGRVWIGTLGGGLDRRDPTTGTMTRFRHDPEEPRSLGAMGVMSLFEDSRGNIWIGTFGGGLNRFEPSSGTFQRFEHDPADPTTVSAPRVTSLAEDSQGRLWVGTDGGGLNRFDPRLGTFERFKHDPEDLNSLSANTVFALHTDSHGRLWVGTRGGGLDLLEDPTAAEITFVNHSHADGLPNRVVYGIEEDLRGNLWISTNFGLSVFAPSSGFVGHYSQSHGLQGNEFNFGAHGRTRSGELLFGGPGGFNVFRPEKLGRNTQPPQLALTSILTGYSELATATPVSELDVLDLSYRDRSVTFEFAALDFAAPYENRFACKLDGFDEQWNELGAVNRVTYTNLSGGNYTLRVRAANADGVWNEHGISLEVAVAPAPWKTWWAYTIYLLAGALAVGGFVLYQRGKLQREERYSRRLEGEVKTRTVELADRNSELEDSNRKLAEASRTDALTGLANRRFLMDLMDREIALFHRQYADLRAGTLTEDALDLVFLMVDLDQFKIVNDTFGHAAGDEVLTQMRDILVASRRATDTIIRWGGDEFLIVARDLTASGTSVLAERIRTAIEEHPFEIGNGRIVRATCSVGSASFPFHREVVDLLTWEQVVSVADRAMYVAKRSGRNLWVGLDCSAATPPDNLYTRIQDDPGGLFEEGVIKVTTSAATADQLIWE